jgi:DNA-binding response OmpR family regulator
VRILVIDDEPVQGEALAEYLCLHGHHADWTVCLTGALALMRLRRYDTVVTDLMLACVSANRLIEGLRSVPHPPAIIALTGLPLQDPVVKGLPAGVPVFQKPMDPEVILAAIEKIEVSTSHGPTIH